MTYDEMLASLAGLESWLQSTAPTVRNTRLSKYRKDLEILADPIKRENLRSHFNEQQLRELFFTFTELYEFRAIFTALQKDYEPILKERLLEVLNGPTSSKAENPANSGNRPRNLQFELLLMAYLVQAGFPISEHNLSDIKSSFMGREVFIECKRPQKQSGIHAAIKDATKQLKRRTSSVNDPISIVALSLTKCITAGETLVYADDEIVASGIVSNAIDQSIKPEAAYFLRQADTSISGMLVVATASTIRRNPDGVAAITKQHFFDNHQLESGRYDLAKKWYDEYQRIKTI